MIIIIYYYYLRCGKGFFFSRELQYGWENLHFALLKGSTLFPLIEGQSATQQMGEMAELSGLTCLHRQRGGASW